MRLRFAALSASALVLLPLSAHATHAGTGSVTTPRTGVTSPLTPEQYAARLRRRDLARKRHELHVRMLRLRRLREEAVRRQEEDEAARRRAEVLLLVNEERRRAGVPEVRSDAVLDRSAQAYAEDMEKRRFFSHENPEGLAFSERIKQVDYLSTLPPCDCNRSWNAGENIASGQQSAAQVMQDWMGSPGHKANILNTAFDRLGIGWKDGYWVQHFFGVREK